jgi:hypothetical protein
MNIGEERVTNRVKNSKTGQAKNAYREHPSARGLTYVGYRGEEQVRSDYSRTQLRRARLQHFLDEPRANAMSDEEHARRGVIIRCEDFVEELDVRFDLGGKQRHVGRLREGGGGRAIDVDVGR